MLRYLSLASILVSVSLVPNTVSIHLVSGSARLRCGACSASGLLGGRVPVVKLTELTELNAPWAAAADRLA